MYYFIFKKQFFFIRCIKKCKNGYTLDFVSGKCIKLHCWVEGEAEIDGNCELLGENKRKTGSMIRNISSVCNETTSSDGKISHSCNCINGIFTSNNKCICVNGYKMREGFVDLCEPECEKECINGFCNKPNECECESGYAFEADKNETNICHQICDSTHPCTADAFTAEKQEAGMNWYDYQFNLILLKF